MDQKKIRQKVKTKDLTICALFAALTAVGAFLKVQIPVEPFAMNFTLQWFFVLMAGLLLGSKRAGMSTMLYLIIGLVGVPVFAAGGGPHYLLRPTFGFLLGFALAAFVMGMIMERGKPSFFRMFCASLAGLLLYYICGMIYFYVISNYVISMPVGWKVVLINCCLITIGEDFVLCVLAVLLCNRLRPTFRKLMEE